jgi:hypothetical protein
MGKELKTRHTRENSLKVKGAKSFVLNKNESEKNYIYMHQKASYRHVSHRH